MKLIIGNKNYSTWSMRPWLLLDAFGLPFEETLVSLGEANLSQRLARYSGSARVPVLEIDNGSIWDSLAICETINEQYLSGLGWPENSSDRALARAITAEMHSGFAALREELPMNIRAKRRVDLSAAALADIQRVDSIWASYARKNSNGDLRLFGEFSIADCFYAPVVMRFITYQIPLSEIAAAYRDSMRSHPSVEKWCAAAVLETEVVAVDEVGVDSE